ncbi:MAG: FemAB family PEP-CTERM system-associated protein [Calditrichaeota bacterium]|nr:FemAB family PEP-CTERM system-associated protein [Calditrichota bacterium]
MNTRLYTPEDQMKWDRFIDSRENGTVFHKSIWKRIIEETFHYESCYFLTEDEEDIKAVLPLFHIKSRFAGNSLISSPFAVYGGVLAENKEAERAILASVRKFSHEIKADYVELRQLDSMDDEQLQTRDSLYCTFKKPLLSTFDENFAKLPKEARRMVRKGIKNGLTATFDVDRIDEFYNIYAASVRHLGTPVFSKFLFKKCVEEFQDDVDLLIIYQNNKPIAGVLSFYYRDTVLPYYGGSLPEARVVSPNNFMYWTLMERARKRGARYFDFGRSKVGTGASKFKQNMGFKPTALPYQYYVKNGNELPDNNPMNPKYKFAINLWKRLPLGLTKWVGPGIVKHFP